MNRHNSEYRAKEKEIKIHNRKKLEYILGRCKSFCRIDVCTYAYAYMILKAETFMVFVIMVWRLCVNIYK